MIARDGEHGCHLNHPAYQPTECLEFGSLVHQIATQQYQVGVRLSDGGHDLLRQEFGSAPPEMDVTDVNDPTCLRMRRNEFFTDHKWLFQAKLPDFTHGFQNGGTVKFFPEAIHRFPSPQTNVAEALAPNGESFTHAKRDWASDCSHPQASVARKRFLVYIPLGNEFASIALLP